MKNTRLKDMKPVKLRKMIKKQDRELSKRDSEILKLKTKNNNLTTKLNGANNTVAKQIDYIVSANANLDKKDSQISILRKEALALENDNQYLKNTVAQLSQSGDRIAKENERLVLEAVVTESANTMYKNNLKANEVIIKYLEMKLNIKEIKC